MMMYNLLPFSNFGYIIGTKENTSINFFTYMELPIYQPDANRAEVNDPCDLIS